MSLIRRVNVVLAEWHLRMMRIERVGGATVNSNEHHFLVRYAVVVVVVSVVRAEGVAEQWYLWQFVVGVSGVVVEQE